MPFISCETCDWVSWKKDPFERLKATLEHEEKEHSKRWNYDRADEEDEDDDGENTKLGKLLDFRDEEG